MIIFCLFVIICVVAVLGWPIAAILIISIPLFYWAAVRDEKKAKEKEKEEKEKHQEK